MRNRLDIVAVLALLLLAACGPNKDETAKAPVAPPAPATPPAPTPPLTYRSANADAEVSLTLPPAVGAVPALYAKLFTEGRNELQAFADGAKGDQAEQRANGEPVRPYVRTLDYAVSAQTPRLVSLVLSELENTGGAHPNTTLSATLWDKQAGKAVTAADLINAGANTAAADKALCDAVHAAKTARAGAPALNGELKACPRLKDAALALAPSTVPGKAGGVIALFSPYALGPYVEGAYRVVVPLAAIQGALAPAYAGEFAGSPAPGSEKGPER